MSLYVVYGANRKVDATEFFLDIQPIDTFPCRLIAAPFAPKMVREIIEDQVEDDQLVILLVFKGRRFIPPRATVLHVGDSKGGLDA
jgi:hypothetical protein